MERKNSCDFPFLVFVHIICPTMNQKIKKIYSAYQETTPREISDIKT
jgi:hypothetical protein